MIGTNRHHRWKSMKMRTSQFKTKVQNCLRCQRYQTSPCLSQFLKSLKWRRLKLLNLMTRMVLISTLKVDLLTVNKSLSFTNLLRDVSTSLTTCWKITKVHLPCSLDAGSARGHFCLMLHLQFEPWFTQLLSSTETNGHILARYFWSWHPRQPWRAWCTKIIHLSG